MNCNTDTLPARTNMVTEVQNKRSKKASDLRSKIGYKCIQIEATVHFDPKLLSREILERWFGVLFRPNVAKITKSSL